MRSLQRMPFLRTSRRWTMDSSFQRNFSAVLTHSIRCPHCGATISASLIPASHNSFHCPRCRSELEVAPPDPLPILLGESRADDRDLLRAGLARVSFVAGIVVATAILYLLDGFVRTLIATPKLRAIRREVSARETRASDSVSRFVPASPCKPPNSRTALCRWPLG